MATDASLWICPGSVFDPALALKEREMCGHTGDVLVHSRATLLRPTDKAAENEIGSIRAIASTGQGCSVAMQRKRNRETDALWGSHQAGKFSGTLPSVWSDVVHEVLAKKEMWLHEVSQGWALSLDWGTHYPQCTSRNCTTQGALDEVGVSPALLGDVYLNLRTYPIRVGNTAEGNSGGWWWDQTEVDWDHVAATCGMDPAILKTRELTTVTKRLRRVATFSYDLVARAARHNGATKIVINFANYICPGVEGLRGDSLSILPKAARVFVDSVERATNVQVVGVGTGADLQDMVWWD